MKQTKTYKLILTLLLLCASLSTFGQGNSVTVAVSLTPPYSLVLSDYAKPASQQLVTTIMVNDMRIVNMPVRLHIKMETATGVTIETAPNILVNALYLSGGMTHLLFGRDLAPYFDINNLNFKGYSKEDYRRTGQLPEGFYRFSVELRHFITGRPVGNPGKAMAWIAIGKPPTLKSPEDKAELGQIQGAALTFSWIPTIVGVPNGGAQYKFELWELRIPGINPNVIVQSMPAKYTATQMNSTLIVHPTEMFLEPGMNYAWRVTASDIAGMLPYAQDGHSEVRTFTYQCKCDSVTNFTVKRVGKQATFKWEPAANHTSFNVEMDNPGSDWTRKEQTFNSQATLNFAEGKTYRMRIQSICNGNAENASPFTNWLSVTIPVPKPIAEDCPNCACENPVPEPKVTNWELRQDLKPGDTIHTPSGKTRFILKSVNLQPDGSYKGLLLVWIEIWRIKILCEYWDLRVNTDNQKVMGKYESVYDPTLLVDVDATEKYVDDLADAIAAISTNTKIRDSIKIGAPLEGAYINKDNQIVLITRSTDGTLTETVSQSTAKMRATLVKGSDGEEYVVTDDGKMMGREEFAATGGDSRLMNNHNEEKESTADPSVTFTAAEGQQYGFDSYTETKVAIQNEYPELKPGYRPAFKSIESYKTDKVQARTTKNVSFRTELGVSPMSSGNDLIVRGGTNGEEIALYAYSKDGEKEVVAGKLTVLSFDENKKTVYLVSVNGATLPNETTLKQELDKIYAPAIVKWTVNKGKALNNVVFPNGKMTHGGSNAISVYNTDQKKIIKAFGSMDKDALYLFFVNNVQGKDGSTKGYMPMQHQSGFIYDNTDAVTVAHELAHGAFNLAHTFDNKKFISAQGTTDNLLDYTGGTQLWKHQWKLINNPKNLLFSFLQDEEDAEMSGKKSTATLSQIIETLKIVGNNGCAFVRKQVDVTNNKQVSTSTELPLAKETNETIQTTNIEYLIGKYENENVSFDISVGSEETKETINAIASLLQNENKEWILYIENGQLAYCEAKEDYTAFTSLANAKKDSVFLATYKKDLLHCKSSNTIYISEILKQLQSDARSTQQNEFSHNGNNYALVNDKIQLVGLSDEDINTGNWSETNIDTRIRYFVNDNGIVQIKSFGFRDNLPLNNGEQKSLPALAKHIKEKSNNFLVENTVTDFKAQAPRFVNDAETFADGGKIEIGGNNSTFIKIISEGVGLTTTLLKTGEIEEKTYLNSTEQEAIIHAPGLVTGTVEAVVKTLTDITQPVMMVYDLVVDKQARTEAYTGLVKIKDQVKDNPTQLFPILGEIILDEVSGNTTEEWQEATDSQTDGGRRGHLLTKGTVRSVATIFASGTFIAKLPTMADDLAKKMGKIVEKRNAISFTAKQIDDYVKLATKNPDAKKVMLGMWDGGAPTSYVAKAGKEYTHFTMGDKWDEVFNLVNKNEDEMWKINKHFIDEQKLKNSEFWCSHDPFLPKDDKFFAREIKYLIDLGAKDFVKEGDLWKIIW
ncbi:hypothetical protein FACS1894199_16370 [Bacteroidia bacterium]|nr:hypothetical protein FACS1894199_16370 [Bacteroidia bacterium]